MSWPSFVPQLAPRSHLETLAVGYAAVQPTVGHAGASRTGEHLPAGFDHIEVSTELAPGSFDRAALAIKTLAMHRASGLLTTSSEPVEAGDTVVLGVPLGPFALVVPCRVTWADETGFGYATLPGHPEAGEESFIVGREPDDSVTFTVRAFSRPAGLSRLGAPIARAAARRAIGRYLAAMRELTA